MPGARVLIASGSAGHGHTMAARAMDAALRLHPVPFETRHVDTVQLMMRAYRGVYRRGYVWLVDKAPNLWRRVYDLTDQKTSRVTHALTRLAGKHFAEEVRAFKPDVVLCTHFLAPEIISPLIETGKIDVRLQCVVTDHDTHRAWYWPAISRYYVASELVKARLSLEYSVPMDHIEVTGIPVRPEFIAPQKPDAMRAQLGIDAERPVVMFLSGGFAAGDMAKAIHGIWLERRDTQIIAVCGHNQRLRKRISKLPRPSGGVLHALPFVEDVASLMAVADIVVAKSGGITTAECAAMGKPLLISGSIPGQEERNADAMMEAGAAVRALTPEEVRWRVGQLLADRGQLARMAANALAFARPNAGRDIAESLVEQLAVESPSAGPYFHGA